MKFNIQLSREVIFIYLSSYLWCCMFVFPLVAASVIKNSMLHVYKFVSDASLWFWVDFVADLLVLLRVCLFTPQAVCVPILAMSWPVVRAWRMETGGHGRRADKSRMTWQIFYHTPNHWKTKQNRSMEGVNAHRVDRDHVPAVFLLEKCDSRHTFNKLWALLDHKNVCRWLWATSDTQPHFERLLKDDLSLWGLNNHFRLILTSVSRERDMFFFPKPFTRAA